MVAQQIRKRWMWVLSACFLLLGAGFLLASMQNDAAWVALSQEEIRQFRGGECWMIVGTPCDPGDDSDCPGQSEVCLGRDDGDACDDVWETQDMNETNDVAAPHDPTLTPTGREEKSPAASDLCSQSCPCYICITPNPGDDPVCVPQPSTIPPVGCEPMNFSTNETTHGDPCVGDTMLSFNGTSKPLPKTFAAAVRFNLNP